MHTGDNSEQFLSVYHIKNGKRKKHISYLENGDVLVNYATVQLIKLLVTIILIIIVLLAVQQKKSSWRNENRKKAPKDASTDALLAPIMPPLPFHHDIQTHWLY